MGKVFDRVKKCCEYCRTQTDFVPKVGIVLGSGLGDAVKCKYVAAEIPYGDIEGFPVSTVEGHAGKFVFAYIEDVPMVLMQGRVHYYEGYSMEDVVLPIRLMKMLGVETLILTNASGGVNEQFQAGDIMMITDQIACFAPSPLIGPNEDGFGTRFPDMSSIYDKELQGVIEKSAETVGIDLKKGVYMQFTGPNFETPAEIRMARVLGADAVGMSTACEAIAANHMGLRIGGISCVVNMAAGIQKTPLNHEEVQEMGRQRSMIFRELILEMMRRIKE